MPRVKRTIRKTHLNRPPGFDEQFWPVVIALIVLGGFLLGLTIAYRDSLSDRRLFWISIVLLPVFLALVITVLRYVGNKLVRRSMQLAVVISIIVHVAVLVGSLESVIFDSRKPITDDFTQPARPPRVITMPDYTRIRRRPDEKYDYQQIVETTTPQPPDREEIEKEQLEEQQIPRAFMAIPQPEQERIMQPSVIPKPSLTQTAPRHRDEQSRLSRQIARAAPTTGTAADQLNDRPEAVRQATYESADLPQLAPRQESVQRANRSEPAIPRRAPEFDIAQRDSPSSDAESSGLTAMLRREVGQERVTPRSTFDSPQTPSVPKRTDLARDSAPISSSTKASDPVVERRAREAPERTANDSSRIADLGESFEQQPNFARTPRPVPMGVRRSTTRRNVVEVDNQLTVASMADRLSLTQPEPRQQDAQRDATQPADGREVSSLRRSEVERNFTNATGADLLATRRPTRQKSQPQPQGTDLARQPVVSRTAEQIRPALNVEAASPSTEIAGALRPRAKVAAAPSIVPESTPTAISARAVTRAEIPMTRQVVELPSAAKNNQGASNAALEPAQFSLDRSVSGVAGEGNSPNIDRGMPSATSPALIASNSAKRSRAVQDTPRGPDLVPSQMAVIRRSLVDQQTATASTIAKQLEVARRSGQKQPATRNATATAALSAASSDARRSSVTAAKGTVHVDLGPPRVIPQNATGRASGGGSPQPNFETDGERLAKANSGGAPDRSLVAEITGEVSAPRAEGGGGPAIPLASHATVIAPAESSGLQPVSGSPARRAPSGEFSRPASTAPPADISATRPPEQVAAAVSGGERLGALRPGRAEAVDAERGARPVIGGGTNNPLSARSRLPEIARADSDEISTAGIPSSTGDPAAQSFDAQGTQVTRRAGGVAGEFERGAVGAAAGPAMVAAVSPADFGPATRKPASRDAVGPLSSDRNTVAAPLTRRTAAVLPSGMGAKSPVAIPIPRSGENERPDATDQLASLGDGTVRRPARGGLPVQLQVADGPGGLDRALETDIGITSRRAREDTELVQPIVTSRFKRSDPGGRIVTRSSAIVPAEAFRGRQRDRRDASGSGQYGPQTERAIELGLMFLERHQAADGRWSFHNFGAGQPGYEQERNVTISSDTAATGLALLAFQGAGYDHRQYKYAEVVRQAVSWLVDQQQPNGDLYVKMDAYSNRSAWLYSHSIAAIALCEAYGMTQDPELREPAQKAVDFIVDSQHQQLGGWRYAPGREADTSVSGWMMMALYSGDLANLEVPEDTYDRIRHWLDLAEVSDSQRHLYCYNPFAPDTDRQRHGRQPSKTMTAVGLVMRLYSGWKRDDVHMMNGAEYLLRHLPTYGTSRNPRSLDHQRDTYYWYYATQVMNHMGGKYWQQWQRRLHPLLIENQTQRGAMAGSWNPRGIIPDKWGQDAGRLYVTSMNLLSLEVQYRKLPIYDDTAR